MDNRGFLIVDSDLKNFNEIILDHRIDGIKAVNRNKQKDKG